MANNQENRQASLDNVPMIRTYPDIQQSRYGIYCYETILHGKPHIIYIGKDSNINIHRRHLDHIAPSRRDVQPFNAYLQNCREGSITYRVMYLCDNETEMNNLEIILIMFYKALGECRQNQALDIKPAVYDQIVDELDKIKGDFIFT